KRLQLRAGIGDSDELLAALPGPLPEEVEVRAGLEGRTRLRRADEEGALEVERFDQSPDRGRVRRVEHLERLDLERAPEHLRRKARAAHSEQDDLVEAVGRGGGEV